MKIPEFVLLVSGLTVGFGLGIVASGWQTKTVASVVAYDAGASDSGEPSWQSLGECQQERDTCKVYSPTGIDCQTVFQLCVNKAWEHGDHGVWFRSACH